MKILIADDHAILRDGLKHLFAGYPGITRVGEADSGRAVLRMMVDNHWDVVLLDLAMPDIGGLEVLPILKQRWPGVPVLVLSMHTEDQYALLSLRAGAAGYLSKLCVADELLAAIECVSRGERYISQSIAGKLAEQAAGHVPAASHECLSGREFQVFCMLVSGMRNAEISRMLELSEKTISTHRSRILDKMKLKNIAELIYYAVEHGIAGRSLNFINGRPVH